MSITTYASLKSTVADVLNRTDLTSAIETFVQSAESRLRRDRRARKIQDREFSVTADNMALPTDFQSLESLYHNGSTYFGEIPIVGASELGGLKGKLGASGVPQYAAVIDSRIRFAPAPNATFALRMLYWLKITPLSDSNTTNWLLLDSPDIYLYATLLESGPYLKDDDRMQMWRTEYDARLEELHMATWNNQWGGQLRQQFKAIG